MGATGATGRGGAKLVLNVCPLHMLWLAMKSEGILFIWGFYFF